jgi:uncharacterized protein (UPF0248 family)
MKEFERKIIGELLEMSGLRNIVLSREVENEVVEFSGAGYLLTIKDSILPKHRIVLDSPDIRGKLGGIDVGYLAFVENSELMLECYSYDQEILPKHRDQEFARDAT